MRSRSAEAIVAIGTSNPVKIAATKRFFRKVFPKKTFRFVSVGTESGIPAQPFDSQTPEGARNRALGALEKAAGAAYGVGIEGGIRSVKGVGSFIDGWVAVAEKDGTTSLGCAGGPLLPKGLMRKILKEGKEMGTAADEFFGTKNIKHSIGVMGISTAGHVSREDAFFYAGVVALSSLGFLRKHPG